MFFDYDFRNYNFRLMAYMIALNVIGVLVVRSATNKDPDFVTKQLMGVMVGLVIAICHGRCRLLIRSRPPFHEGLLP